MRLVVTCFLTILTTTSTVKLPTCNVKTQKVETPCFRFQQNQDCCSLDYVLGNNETMSTQHLTMKRSRWREPFPKDYTSAVISIPSSANITNEFLLMLHHHLPSAPLLCWDVQLKDNNDASTYGAVVIKFILRTDFADGWNVSTYSTDECGFTFDEPIERAVKMSMRSMEAANETAMSCDRFRRSKTTFKATSARQELEFSVIWNASLHLELQISHLSAPHVITCNGSVNHGVVQPPAIYPWYKVSVPWTHPVDVGYHCLTIALRDDHTCAIYTETEHIEDPGNRPPVQGEAPSRLPTIVLAAALCCACVTTLLVAVYKLRDHFRFRGTSQLWNGSGGLSPLLANRRRILLLYSRDSDEFSQLARAFRHLLELLHDSIEIIDPFDDYQFEMISRNTEMWLTELLFSPNVKVILITSEGAIIRQNALKSGHLISGEPHCLDTVFTSALNHLRNPHLTISQDYKRMFLVRFDGLPGSVTPIGITPFRCFILLHHWGDFIKEITGMDWMSIYHCTGFDESSYNAAVEHFKTSLEQVIQHRSKHPDFISQRWAVINHIVHTKPNHKLL